MQTIVVTGGQGQLGSEFRQLSTQYPDWHFRCPDRHELDITDPEQIARYWHLHQPRYCFNAAAYTAVDRAESEVELAELVNVKAVGYLADACAAHNTHLFHFSTDYVYEGHFNRPIREEDATGPNSVYGQTKLAGEQVLLQKLPAATIVRTSWVYSTFGHNFVKTMLRLGRERDQLQVVFDQIGSPTYARDLAAAGLEILRQLEQQQIPQETLSGIYHYSHEGVCSWYDFAAAIFELAGIDCQLSPILSEAYPTPATRPHFSLLDKAKIKAAFGLEIPHWREGLKRCLAELGEV